MPAPASDGDRSVDRGDGAVGDAARESGLTRRSVLTGAGVALGSGVVGAAGLGVQAASPLARSPRPRRSRR
ncbi:hypothetical protein ACFQL4_21960 [Halosimplex aquaticum]